ncbi:MAG: glutamate--tRNA ligase family protein [Candidatus Nomurabacteria bacterium]
MTTENKKIVTRFAPSPTGFLHIGGARSALFNYLYTKQNEGRIILRIEDTDLERNKQEFTDGIIKAFKWLNLEFDDTFMQSDNFHIHRKYLEKLISDGHAYISKEEVKEEGQRSEVVRFKNPNKKITFVDMVKGEITFDTTDLGDFVIAKSLDEPIFHLSNVVDDIIMGITHVIRGEEHISNVPRQILIWEAINERERPVYGHIPLILSEIREKLSKRKHGEMVSVEYYEKNGYLAEAMINFVSFLGWNPGGEEEIFSLNELIEKFNINKVQKGGAVFNVEKLNWFNKEYIKKQSEEEQVIYIKKYLPEIEKYSEELIQKLRPVLIDRINFYGELKSMHDTGELEYYIFAPVFDNSNEEKNPEKLIWKKSDKENTLINLQEIKDILEKNVSFDIEDLWKEIYTLAEVKGKGDILWPLRYCLSGKEKSPDPKTLLSILGITESVSRIENAITALK